MVQLRRAALSLAVCCYSSVDSFAGASSTNGNMTASTTSSSVIETTNTTGLAKTTNSIETVYFDECEIEFWYWDHDFRAHFGINFVYSKGTDSTHEVLDGGDKPQYTSNNEAIRGELHLVQIYPRDRMACISAIKLTCGGRASGLGEAKAVTITADALQQSWINKTGGQRKPVDWNQGPCMYFRDASWDTGAFRALDIHRSAFNCGEDYYCIARNIETFGN